MNNTDKQRAQETVLDSIQNNIRFSIEFYEQHYQQFLEKVITTTGGVKEHNENMAQHCLYMKESYETLLNFINHFKY